LLRPDATHDQIVALCHEAVEYGFASVCVNSCWVALVAAQLAATPVKVCTVVGFPLGASASEVKVAEAEYALRYGAQEIDMVINIGALCGGDIATVGREISSVVEVSHRAGAIVKVIIETALLSDEQKVLACKLAVKAGADFVTIDNARLYRRVERQNRTLKTLANISREFSSILDLNELLGKIASTMRDLIDYDAFSILLVDHEAKALRHLFSIRYDQRVNIDNVPLGKGLTGAAAESREVVRVHDTAKDPRYIASHPDIRSEVAVPLIVQDRVVGVMDLESDRVGYFTDDHVRTLALLAPQVASSVENARLYAELAAARAPHGRRPGGRARIAAVLLPDAAPEIEGLDAAVRLRPAREISGDIYDIFEQRDGRP
jgi:deoxyribose-phosphate aldolase